MMTLKNNEDLLNAYHDVNKKNKQLTKQLNNMTNENRELSELLVHAYSEISKAMKFMDAENGQMLFASYETLYDLRDRLSERLKSLARLT